MGLFDMFDDQEDIKPASVPLPNIPELSAQEKMQMEKETTGLYLSGHPMDDYRAKVKKVGAVPIGEILESFGEEESGNYQDGQTVAVAGIVTKVKSKTTKNGSLMAYVTLEDDTGVMELLCFSRVLGQYGGCLTENTAVLVKGKISVRDEKDPQLMTDSAVPLSDVEDNAPAQEARPIPKKPQTLYLKVPGIESREFRKLKPILHMFPGNTKTVLVMADTRQKMGTTCLVDEYLLAELSELLGQENVVVK